MKRVALSVVALAVAFVLVFSGQAVATTWYLAPSSGSTSGPATHAYASAWYTVFTLSATTGGGATHTGAYWYAPIIAPGDAYVYTWIWSGYAGFTPPTSDYYTVTFDWYLTGYATLENFWLPGYAGDNILVGITLVSYLFDTTRGITNWCHNTTVLSASNGLPGWDQTWPYSNTYYPLQCQLTLLAGDNYVGQTYIETYNEAAGTGVTIGTSDSVQSLTVSQPHLTFYENTPPPPPGGGCILSGTSILLPGGDAKKVEKLQAGDRIMGYNFSSGSLQPIRVISNTPTYVSEVVSLNNGLLVVTPTDQPLYVRNGTWTGWVRDPDQLRIGEMLFNPTSGTWVALTTIQTLTGSFKVWDLATSPLNNFIANGVLADRKTP